MGDFNINQSHRWEVWLVVAVLLGPALLAAQSARRQVLEGNRLYQQEKYDEANNKYRDALVNNPDNPIIHFNIGNALYKKKNYEESMKNYEKSLVANDVLKQSQSYYNMGNALYRLGKLPESILAYTQALKLNPDDQDAKYNLEFVRAKLKEQAQKQPQNNQQQQHQQQQDQQQSQSNDEQQKAEQQQQEPQPSEEQQSQQKEQQTPETKDQSQMSKEEAERILDALKEDEKDLQKEKKSARQARVRVLKDW